MRRWTKIISIFISLTLACSAQAQEKGPQDRFKIIYRSIVDTIQSRASLEEKINSIDSKSKDFVIEVRKLSNTIDSKDYAFAWDLFDEIIPLLNLKLDESKQKLTQKSCLEAMSLVSTKERPELADEDVPSLSTQGQYTLKLIESLCKSP